MAQLDIKLSPTQHSFVISDATIPALIGPFGEGKTFGGVCGAIMHRERAGVKTLRGAIVRDTFENIKKHTIPSIFDAVGEYVRFADGKKRMLGLGLDLDLIGIDDLGSMTKLQGPEYGFVWLEEPAPIYDKANAGLPEEVFNTALTRAARQKGTIPRLQITMNPASEDHWTYHKLFEDPINDDPDFPDISTEVFQIPYGENSNISDISRQTVKAGYRNSPELWARYVEGKFSFVTEGVRVVPGYTENLHRAKFKLSPVKGIPAMRFWDGGGNPTCVFAQYHKKRLIILDSVMLENAGMKQLIDTKVKPLLESRYGDVTEWSDVGDPSLGNMEQSDAEQSGEAVINEELGASFIKGKTHWEPRRESLHRLMDTLVDGEPMLIISSHEGLVHRALKGGWHYKKDNQGRIVGKKPVKDRFSHAGDALSYGVNYLLPWKPRASIPSDYKNRMRKRAASYVG